ncbi:hypothetical protein DPE44_19140 [Salmonella enterica subsp. salamae]|uniref:Uncharacterized protein n=1 Tax=Salmonella enterica subsp. salamae TaxID=59202 RepID=A0A5Y3MQH9_SALER|nr:hypothetical protein [Salmonella enterica subsp. salamae]EAM5462510.1 hypothetical protein [Salmonella enterica]EAP7915670.1 hypothetical protein [Salmonella enterica]EAP9950727.1 hypothetical protein [Salmonella enterica]ECC9703864.1 hypothetical protein [Salmonella enterica subsp. salamae]
MQQIIRQDFIENDGRLHATLRNQKISAACANQNRLIINPLSNNRPADFPAVGSRVVVNGE